MVCHSLAGLQVSSEVLVETYEEGDHITHYITGGQTGAAPARINQRLSIIGSGTMLQVRLRSRAALCVLWDMILWQRPSVKCVVGLYRVYGVL